MKPISDIVFGFSDAENYRRKENRDLFNQIFLQTDALGQILKTKTSFLVGDKGTGKTAYAVFLSNSKYNNAKPEKGMSGIFTSLHKFIRETDYQKFMTLKKQNDLLLSEYVDIWKVIIYLIFAGAIKDSSTVSQYLINYPKFTTFKKTIDEYYGNAFSPKIPIAFQFVENSKQSAELLAKAVPLQGKIATEETLQITGGKNVFQTRLLFLEKQFEGALRDLKLRENFILFIDGVDVRPETIPFSEYLECVKGLANAVWSINNDFFAGIKDSPGRMRVVLLIRPDIFNILNLQNRNTKLRDNAVVLDWRTSYPEHRRSYLFTLADKMFAVQQEKYDNKDYIVGRTWDRYFPFDAAAFVKDDANFSSFVVFLRYALSRPRDILTMLDILGKNHQSSGRSDVFTYNDLMTSRFKKTYGDYALGEIKDSLSFYYDESEFQIFLKFFEFLSGAYKFDYSVYLDAYDEIVHFLTDQGKELPTFMKSPEEFIQFLFDLNVISFKERSEDGSEVFIRWCYQERTPTNISPKIKLNSEYEIHYALTHVLNTGKTLKRAHRVRASAAPTARGKDTSLLRGKIKFINTVDGYGFLVSKAIPVDIYFRLADSISDISELIADRSVEFRLVKDNGGRLRAQSIKAFG